MRRIDEKSTGRKEDLMRLIRMGRGNRSVYHIGNGEFVVVPTNGKRHIWYENHNYELVGVYSQDVPESDIMEDVEFVCQS